MKAWEWTGERDKKRQTQQWEEPIFVCGIYVERGVMYMLLDPSYVY